MSRTINKIKSNDKVTVQSRVFEIPKFR